MHLLKRDTLEMAKENEAFLNDLIQSEEASKFVKYVIKEYTKSPANFMAVNKVEWEDLLQAGYIGLFNAIRKMDLSLSPKEWIKYTFLSIKGEIRSFSRSNDSNMIVIQQRIRELYPKYKKFHEEFWIQYQADPTIAETMKHFGITKDDAFALVYGMQEMIYQQHAEVSSKNEQLEPAQYEKAKTRSVEEQAINHILVKMVLEFINEKQRKVIYLYYFLGFSKTEISRMIGCSQSMVGKHITSAFTLIRKEFGHVS